MRWGQVGTDRDTVWACFRPLSPCPYLHTTRIYVETHRVHSRGLSGPCSEMGPIGPTGHAKACYWTRAAGGGNAGNAGNAGNSSTPSRVTGSCQSLEGYRESSPLPPLPPQGDQVELDERLAIQGEFGGPE